MTPEHMLFPTEQFPCIERTGVNYFDFAATTFMPNRVMDRWRQVNEECGVFLGRGANTLTRKAETIIADAEAYFHHFFGLSNEYSYAYSKNVTEEINLVALGIEHLIRPLDFIVVGPYEHHSNYLPWRALAKRTGALFCEIPLNEYSQPDYSYIERFRDRIKVISISSTCNTIGYKLDISKICASIGDDTFLFVDESQVCGHAPIYTNSRIDGHFLASHKMYGPKNIAMTALSERAIEQCNPVLLGGGMVDTVGHELVWSPGRQKFLSGTMDTALIASWAESCRFIDEITYRAIEEWEVKCNALIRSVISRCGWELLSKDNCAAHILTFVHPTLHAHDVNDILSSRYNIAIRSGHLCAQNAIRKLGHNAVNRISFGLGLSESNLANLCVALEDLAND